MRQRLRDQRDTSSTVKPDSITGSRTPSTSGGSARSTVTIANPKAREPDGAAEDVDARPPGRSDRSTARRAPQALSRRRVRPQQHSPPPALRAGGAFDSQIRDDRIDQALDRRRTTHQRANARNHRPAGSSREPQGKPPPRRCQHREQLPAVGRGSIQPARQPTLRRRFLLRARGDIALLSMRPSVTYTVPRFSAGRFGHQLEACISRDFPSSSRMTCSLPIALAPDLSWVNSLTFCKTDVNAPAGRLTVAPGTPAAARRPALRPPASAVRTSRSSLAALDDAASKGRLSDRCQADSFAVVI